MSRQQSFSQGLWIGWAIGTSFMTVPLIVLVVTR